MKKRMMVLIPLFFLLALVLVLIRTTFALFETNRVDTSLIDIAKWQVKINNDTIDGSSDTFTVNNFVWTTSSKVKSGKAAPGLSGYFEIEINPNNTETAVRYDLNFDFSNLNANQFEITNISEVDGKTIYRTGEYTYSNIFTLDDIENGETNTIRVNIKWSENEENNQLDSDLVKDKLELTIPVTIDITQHFDGETLEVYTP